MAVGVTLVTSIGIEYKVAPHLLSTGNYTALAYLLYQVLLLL